MDVFSYLMTKNGHNYLKDDDLFSYVLAKGKGGTYATFTGTSINANNTRRGKMKLSLKGNTSQTGTPTPSSPKPVNVVSGDNEVVVCGKNLTNVNQLTTRTINGITITNNGDGSLTLNGTSTGEIALDFKIPVTTLINGNTYTFSKRTTIGGGLYALLFRTPSNQAIPNSVLNTNLDSSDEYKILTCNSNVEIGYMRLYIPNNKVITSHTIYPMLEKGSSMTTFEPYQSQTYHITLPNGMEFCGIGDYKDGFAKNSDGQWCKYNAIGSKDFTSTNMTMNYLNIYDDYRRLMITKTTIGIPTGWVSGIALCNYFKEISGSTPISIGTFNTDKDSANLFVYLPTTINTLAEAKTYMDSLTNSKIYYVLATSTNTEITNNTLIEQLNTLEQALSYNNQTNISQENNNLPFVINATALMKNSD